MSSSLLRAARALAVAGVLATACGTAPTTTLVYGSDFSAPGSAAQQVEFETAAEPAAVASAAEAFRLPVQPSGTDDAAPRHVVDPQSVTVATAGGDAPTVVLGAGTGRSGVFAAPWGLGVEGVDNGDGSWSLQATGLPDHEIDALIAIVGEERGAGQPAFRIVPNPAAAQGYVVTLPLDPTPVVAPLATGRGVIGLMVSGAALFGPVDGDGQFVVERNFEFAGAWFLDACNGHSGSRGTYHYHGVPHCLTDAVDDEGAHSTMIGVLLDGFPIYGPRDVGGIEPLDLDECGGHVGATPEFETGTYHYHLSEQAPHGIPCFRGIPQALERTAPVPIVGGSGEPREADPRGPARVAGPGDNRVQGSDERPAVSAGDGGRSDEGRQVDSRALGGREDGGRTGGGDREGGGSGQPSSDRTASERDNDRDGSRTGNSERDNDRGGSRSGNPPNGPQG